MMFLILKKKFTLWRKQSPLLIKAIFIKVIRKWKAFDVSTNNLSGMSPSFLTFQSLKPSRCCSSFSNEIYNLVRI